jgi:5-methylcytosine-specific restriction endonuclease McrA
MSSKDNTRKPRILTAEQMKRKRLANNKRARAYRAAHPEKVRAWRVASRALHGDKERARCRVWRAEHSKEQRAYNLAYYAMHRVEILAHVAAWHLAHPGVRHTRNIAWYAAHIGEMRARSVAYAAMHREERRAAYTAWEASHPEERRTINARRRARKRGAPVNDFTTAQWLELQIVFDYCCAYCGKRAKGKLTQDHITPLVNGGNHTLANIVPACRCCNSRKRTGAPLISVQPLLLTIAPSNASQGRGKAIQGEGDSPAYSERARSRRRRLCHQ